MDCCSFPWYIFDMHGMIFGVPVALDALSISKNVLLKEKFRGETRSASTVKI